MQQQALIADVAAALDIPAAQAAGMVLEPCNAGGNNRVFSVTVDGRKLVAKWYYRHLSDQRDRLKAEYTFLSCVTKAGIRCVPQPVACDTARGIGIYEHVEGRRLAVIEIGTRHVDEAAEFFLQLNHTSMHRIARELPNASEACFSMEEHFSMVDARIEKLGTIPGNLGIDADARAFATALGDHWQDIKSGILRKARIKPNDILRERCISPSDFGFHNALLTPRGICFLDFEYAGWDDPAKMAGDFFSHPAVPVDILHFERFLNATMRYAPEADALAERARLLFPVFQTKWCCIILNDFLPAAAQRRRFADAAFNEVARKREQLSKAQQLFALIKGGMPAKREQSTPTIEHGH